MKLEWVLRMGRGRVLESGRGWKGKESVLWGRPHFQMGVVNLKSGSRSRASTTFRLVHVIYLSAPRR